MVTLYQNLSAVNRRVAAFGISAGGRANKPHGASKMKFDPPFTGGIFAYSRSRVFVAPRVGIRTVIII